MAAKIKIGKQLVNLLVIFLAIFTGFIIIFFKTKPDGKLHLVFCNVGQGDAILIKTPKGDQVLIDGGPDNSVLSCLGKAMPFWDRTLELVVLTHPQSDHLTGLVTVFENYKVEKILRTSAENPTSEFAAFKNAELEEKAKKFEAKSGMVVNLDNNLTGRILWPESSIFGLNPDLNDTSIVLRLEYYNFCAIFTGDATNNAWFQLQTQGKLGKCFLLKIAHHGSKNATNFQFLDLISPKIAVISAGINNRYGHPHEETLELLRNKEIKILRTDEKGTIEVITNGKGVEIRN